MSHTNEIEAFRMFHRRVSAVQLNECRIGRDALISQPSRNSFGAANRPSSAPPPASRAVRRRSEIAPLKARAYGCSVAIDVRPATADRWSDLVAVFGRRGQDPSWCWCQLFLAPVPKTPRLPQCCLTTARPCTKRSAAPPFRPDSSPMWTTSPQAGLESNRERACPACAAARPWHACSAKTLPHLVDHLLRGRQPAPAHGRRLGSTPWRRRLRPPSRCNGRRGPPGRRSRPSSRAACSGSSLYTGTKAMFAAAGFVEVARTAPTRPVMRLSLRGRLPL